MTLFVIETKAKNPYAFSSQHVLMGDSHIEVFERFTKNKPDQHVLCVRDLPKTNYRGIN